MTIQMCWRLSEDIATCVELDEGAVVWLRAETFVRDGSITVGGWRSPADNILNEAEESSPLSIYTQERTRMA